MSKAKIKPEHYEYYRILEQIREDGVVNMWGAAPVLISRTRGKLGQEEVMDCLLEFITNFTELVDTGIIHISASGEN